MHLSNLVVVFFFQISTTSIFLILVPENRVNAVISWCYNPAANCGPRTWTGNCTPGLQQSPINIIPSNTTKAKANRSLIFSSQYFDTNDFTILNTGRSIVIDAYYAPGAPRVSDLQVKGSGLNGTYMFLEIQFRWGSEHMLKGERAPLEMQIIHKQLNGGGLAFFSILFNISKTPSKPLAPIVSMLSTLVKKSNASQRMSNGLNVGSFLPKVWDVFRYSGSVTMPPCQQGVVWTVFTQKMPVSQAQVDAFAKIQDENNQPLKKAYRPIQPTYTKERKTIYWMQINRSKMRQQAF